MAGPSTQISFGEDNSGFQVGQNNGSIHAEFHLPPEPAETPPLPSSNVPFRRDPDFVERGTVLSWLHQSLSQPAARVALTGLGGIGKTQLAIEYTYRLREQSPDTWMLWIHASNAARYEQSIRDAADQLKISGRANPQANIYQLVHNRLFDAKKGKWLLVLDNADETDFLFEPPSKDGSEFNGINKPLIQYLPPAAQGSILVTTRSKRSAQRLADSNSIAEVSPMNADDSLALLFKKTGTDHDTDAARHLIAQLEYIPLAISQAGAYIKQRWPRSSIRGYSEKLEQSAQSRSSLLNHDSGILQRDWEAKNSILLVWEISFEHITLSRPSAADLLSLMSFYDRQGIPDILLRLRYEDSDRDHDVKGDAAGVDQDAAVSDDEAKLVEVVDEEDFENDITTLRDYSLIEYDEHANTFTMHRLVQLATQRWLEARDRHQLWQEESLRRLDVTIPHENFPQINKDWDICRLLYPHVKRALELKTTTRQAAIRRASVLHNMWQYARTSGNALDAGNFIRAAAEGREQNLGAEHRATIESKSMLAWQYLSQGRLEAARNLMEEQLDAARRIFGEDDVFTVVLAVSLAQIYSDLGQNIKAMETHERCQQLLEAKPGVRYQILLLVSLSYLSVCYERLGESSRATQTLERSYEIAKTRLGEDHPATLTSMACLAQYYYWSGEESKGAELQELCWKMRKVKLGEDHPDTLASMEGHALLLNDQGHTAAATQIMEDCVNLSVRKLGGDHPDTKKRLCQLKEWQSEQLSTH